MSELTAAQRVKIARTLGRPGTLDFVNALFTDVFVCKGDRLHREDPSIFGPSPASTAGRSPCWATGRAAPLRRT